MIRDYEIATLSKSQRLSAALIYALRSYKFRVVLRLRLSQHIGRTPLRRRIGKILYVRNCRRGVDIHPNAKIGPGLRLAHPWGIVVGEHVEVGKCVRLMHGVTLGGSGGKKDSSDPSFSMPRLGDYCLIGAGAKILGPVKIGVGSVVGANAVVTKSVPPWTVVGGIPALELKRITKQNVTSIHNMRIVSIDEVPSR